MKQNHSIMLGNTPLADYVIVFAKEGADSDPNIQAAKYTDTVAVFVSMLENQFGITLPTHLDGEETPFDKPYILFGHTTITQNNPLYTSDFLASGFDSYAVDLLENNNLAIAGNNAVSTLAAATAMVDAIKHSSSLTLSGKADLVRVGCIGDSITFGSGSDDPSMESYPVYLQRMLGYRYFVEKFGAPGHSLIKTDSASFLTCSLFPLAVASCLDVAFVMLGTNDCRSQKWADSAYKDWTDPGREKAFLADGQSLVDELKQSNPNMQIIFATCPTVPQDQWKGSDWTERLSKYGNPLIHTIASRNQCDVIDIFTYSQNHLEMFEDGDGLHLKNEKYKMLARGFYELSKDIIRK